MINLEIEDVKVLGANIVCMIALEINAMNIELQSILFLATIGYTIVRTANEIQKFIRERNGKADVGSAEPDQETKI